MGCRLSDFDLTSEAQTLIINGHTVEIANATSKPINIGGVARGGKLEGVVYKVNGKFQGFTGTADAVRHWVEKDFPPR